jgi:hypothetical protein
MLERGEFMAAGVGKRQRSMDCLFKSGGACDRIV